MEMVVSVEGPHSFGFSAAVHSGKNFAMHTGFNSKEQAENWSTIISKKIEKQQKELLKHTAFVRT